MNYLALLVDLFTVSGMAFALLAFEAVVEGDYTMMFTWLLLAVMIDAWDGVLARFFKRRPGRQLIDGALLDNIVDYCTYTIVPCFFLLQGPLLPEAWQWPAASLVALTSGLQFSLLEAKTDSHFFTGFPSYWNVVVFFLYTWSIPAAISLTVIFILSLLHFVPIRYLYLTRLDFLQDHPHQQRLIQILTGIWGIAMILALFQAPNLSLWVSVICWSYLPFYAACSLYYTLKPPQEEIVAIS